MVVSLFKKFQLKTNDKKYQITYRRVRCFVLSWLRNFTCEGCLREDLVRSYHFHHKDPEDKLFNVGDNGYKFGDRVRESLKCSYLCETCHYTEHNKIGDLDGYYDTIDRRGYNIIQSVLGLSA